MNVLIVEDDQFYARLLSETLADIGLSTSVVGTVEQALEVSIDSFDAALIDVMLPNNPDVSGISAEECRGGFLAGVALARRIRKNAPKVKTILITAEMFPSQADEWAHDNGIPLVRKHESSRSLVDSFRSVGILPATLGPRAFIVHGHDETSLLQLKNYLQNYLKWPEPIILREQPSCGKTIIEKFEEYSQRVDCVFVLLSPDDLALASDGQEKRRSRQNVIFELGFFFAHFGRRSGRIIVLYKGPQELPSDIQGIVWISIEGGVEAAGELIRREVAKIPRWIPSVVLSVVSQ